MKQGQKFYGVNNNRYEVTNVTQKTIQFVGSNGTVVTRGYDYAMNMLRKSKWTIR